jgi:hypothetical protein
MELITPVKHLDSGIKKDVKVVMDDGNLKEIENINIGDKLNGNNGVLGKITLFAPDHIWFSYENMILSDNTKIFEFINWKSVAYGKPVIIDDRLGYNIITETGEFEVNNGYKNYKVRDFLQTTDKLTLDNIEEYTLSFMNLNKNP